MVEDRGLQVVLEAVEEDVMEDMEKEDGTQELAPQILEEEEVVVEVPLLLMAAQVDQELLAVPA